LLKACGRATVVVRAKAGARRERLDARRQMLSARCSCRVALVIIRRRKEER
jgi:hypothetical protein